MTQDKELLLKDLCARLPYDVKCKVLETNEVKILGSIQYDRENTLFDFWEDSRKIVYDYQLYLSEFKPYLFPLSSMTEEQRKEFDLTLQYIIGGEVNVWTLKTFDWCDKHHFDYRGLLKKGLAIDATELNVY